MKITKHKSQELYTCTVENRSFTSPDYSSVMKWRDENVQNAEYYKEIKELHDKQCKVCMIITQLITNMITSDCIFYTNDDTCSKYE